MKSWSEQRAAWSVLTLAVGCTLGAAGCTGYLSSKDDSKAPSPGGGGSNGVPVGSGGRPIVADPTSPEQVAAAVNPKRELGLQRLTKSQYVNTLTDLFAAVAATGLDVEVDYRSAGFASIGGREVAISRSGARKYEAAARLVAERVVSDTALRGRLASCAPQGATDSKCLSELVGAIGRRLFRRALTAEETQRYVSVGTPAGQAFSDFWQGAKFALTGLLLSPSFLYQVELGTERSGQRVLTDLELATRLSYFLWDTTPDDALLGAAERGELSADSAAQHTRLLADKARLAQGVRAFSQDLFSLYELDSAPQSTAFPEATPSLYASMREAVQRLTVEVTVEQRSDFRNVLDPGFAFVDRELSAWYGMNATNDGFTKLTFGSGSGRVGLLTEPGILALTSRATRSSPTLRGIFVSDLVCFETPPPPPNVNATLPDRMDGMTRRQQLEVHMNQPTCAACHKAIDPIGFGLEQFDAIGRERSQTGGGPVDTTGTYFDQPFDGPAQLSKLVKEDPRLAPCAARKAYMHGLARIPDAQEDVLIEPLAQAFSASGYDLAALLGTVAESGLFQLAPKPVQ